MKKYIIYVVLLSIFELGMSLYLTFWREEFWQDISLKNYEGFILQLGIFILVALALCIVSAFNNYFLSIGSIKWREILDAKAHELNIWKNSENGNQRVQQDCRDYPDLYLNIIFGLGKAILYVIVFSISLCINFNSTYLTIILIYAILSTFIARKIAKPLISLNYQSQVKEATYRNMITIENFKECINNMLTLAIKTKHLNYFQSFYAQIAAVIPIIIVAPEYFLGSMTLGSLMQSTSTMSVISENCSYGIYSFNTINKYISCKIRLKEIGVI